MNAYTRKNKKRWIDQFVLREASKDTKIKETKVNPQQKPEEKKGKGWI